MNSIFDNLNKPLEATTVVAPDRTGVNVVGALVVLTSSVTVDKLSEPTV